MTNEKKRYNWMFTADKTVGILEHTPVYIGFDTEPTEWNFTGLVTFRCKYEEIAEMYTEICEKHQSLKPIYDIEEEDNSMFDKYMSEKGVE